MHVGTTDIIIVGIIAIVVGTLVLVAMARYDLAPAGGFARGGQWLVATALGTGIIAFTIKLGIIVAMLTLPELLIDPLIAKPEVPRPPSIEDPLMGAYDSPRYVWQALPTRVALDTAAAPQPQVWRPLPTTVPAPRDNPTTPEKVALGERLFHDKNLSRDRTLSCATCHNVRTGAGTDGRPTSLGIEGQVGKRNAPTVFNAAFQAVQFWDGRAPSLEEQAKGPLTNPVEMGMPSHAEVEQRVRADAAYREPFARAFGAGTPITIDRIAQAIAAYERTKITPDAPYDRFVRGDLHAMTPRQLRGMGLFQSLGCINCHGGPNFSAASVFDGKAPLRIFPAYPTPYETRYALTADIGGAAPGSGRGNWRIPSLRNIALTGPYFHNGSVKDLAEAVRIMASAELGRTGRYLVWSDRAKSLTELETPVLGEQEVNDVVAFLRALTSDSLATQVRSGSERRPMQYAQR
jgi:cytochrome c peroxidase